MLALRIIILLAVLAFFAAMVIRAWRAEKPKSLVVSGALGIIAIILLLTIVYPSFGEVPAGYGGVVIRFSAVTGRIVGEGIYFVTPGVEHVELMPLQILKLRADVPAASKDLQDVQTTVVVNYQLDVDNLPWIYRKLARDWEERIVKPSIQEAVKAAQANYEAEELIQQRQQVRGEMAAILEAKLAAVHIHVIAMNIEDFSFSEQFDEAIEKKVTMEQRALEAVRNAERQYYQSRADSIEAVLPRLAEAEGIRQIGLAKADAIAAMRRELTADGGERYVELTKAERWSGALPNVTGGVIPFLNLNQDTQ